ncbi:MAG TPA: hypothetical protein VF870_13995 [Ignavibacteriaceae bacterium]
MWSILVVLEDLGGFFFIVKVLSIVCMIDYKAFQGRMGNAYMLSERRKKEVKFSGIN